MVTLSDTVGHMVAEWPARARAFDEAGIDYCLGREQSLAEACRRSGVDPDRFLDRLSELDRRRGGATRDWSETSVADLCDDIVETFHNPLREELPRLGMLLCHVAEGHGWRHPELNRVLELFSLFSGELKLHMTKEEDLVFPLIRDMELTRDAAEDDLIETIETLELEHESARHALAAIREMTHDFRPPADACGAYRTVLDGLLGLEHDLNALVGIEENVLFPRVLHAQFAGDCY